MGIPTERMSALGWAIGLGCVGVAGTMLSTFFYIFPDVGVNFALAGVRRGGARRLRQHPRQPRRRRADRARGIARRAPDRPFLQDGDRVRALSRRGDRAGPTACSEVLRAMASDQARMLELREVGAGVAAPAAVGDGARVGGGSLPAGLPVPVFTLTLLASPRDPHSALCADGAVLERRRRALRPDQPRARDLLRHRRLLLHRPVREVRHHAMDRTGGRHRALRARRRRHRRADAAPARALLRHRHASDRLERADHRAAMGLGRAPHPVSTSPSTARRRGSTCSSIRARSPTTTWRWARPRPAMASSGCCGAAASASACRHFATSPMRQQASASPSRATRSWPS